MAGVAVRFTNGMPAKHYGCVTKNYNMAVLFIFL